MSVRESSLAPPGSTFSVTATDAQRERWVYRSRLLGVTCLVVAVTILWIGVEVTFFTFGSPGLLGYVLFFGLFLGMGFGLLRVAWIVWDDPVVMMLDLINRSASIRKRTFLHTWQFSIPLDQVTVSIGPLRAGRQLVATEWVVADLGAPGWIGLGRAASSTRNREFASEIARRWGVAVEETDQIRIGRDNTCRLNLSSVRQLS